MDLLLGTRDSDGTGFSEFGSDVAGFAAAALGFACEEGLLASVRSVAFASVVDGVRMPICRTLRLTSSASRLSLSRSARFVRSWIARSTFCRFRDVLFLQSLPSRRSCEYN